MPDINSMISVDSLNKYFSIFVSLLPYLLIIVVLLIFWALLKKWLSPSNAKKGEMFEKYIVKQLMDSNPQAKVLQNTHIPVKKGTTEIDIIYINCKGIFVIEAKNCSGAIYGNEDDFKWTQAHGKLKTQFFNPIKQNEGHINALKNYIGDYNYISLIVFSKNSKIKKLICPNTTVVQSDNLIKAVIEKTRSSESLLNSTQIDKIYQKLTNIDSSEKTKKDHINRLQASKG